MVPGSYAIRLDPWAPEYQGALQLGALGDGDDEAAADAAVDLDAEGIPWQAVRPGPAPSPQRLAFVDGVRRIEHRLLVEQAGRSFFGLLGSFGVGATRAELQRGAARVEHPRIRRVFCVGGGLDLGAFEAPFAPRQQPFTFTPEAVADTTPMAPVQGLQNAMRREEAALAAQLGEEAAAADVVFLDGPLTFLDEAKGPIVGVIKRLIRTYLPPEAAALLPRLAVGERTPLFLVTDARHARYSWYARIATGRAIESSLTGILRLETAAEGGLARARAVADASARELMQFASDAAHDPRAPQNLYPIGALEAQLRHLLGDPQLVRRAVEARLHQEAVS
jgi:hypothetical protein